MQNLLQSSQMLVVEKNLASSEIVKTSDGSRNWVRDSACLHMAEAQQLSARGEEHQRSRQQELIASDCVFAKMQVTAGMLQNKGGT